MLCKYGSVNDYKESTYEELLELRSKVMEDIISFEKDKISDKSRVIKPGAEYEYRLNLEFLSELIVAINKRFQMEHRELLKAIGSGDFKASGDEGTVAQIKRYTKIINDDKAVGGNTVGDRTEMEFSVSNDGSIEAFIDGELAGTVTDIDATEIYDFGEVISGRRVYLLLEAECHNRKYIGAGGLRKTEWQIYSDGSYIVKSTYNLSWNDLEKASEEEAEAGRETVSSGIIEDDRFRLLQAALSKEVWRTTEPKRRVREGSLWMIVMYDANGRVFNSSGDFDYIDGVKNLEAIVACLPADNKERRLTGKKKR